MESDNTDAARIAAVEVGLPQLASLVMVTGRSCLDVLDARSRSIEEKASMAILAVAAGVFGFFVIWVLLGAWKPPFFFSSQRAFRGRAHSGKFVPSDAEEGCAA